MAGKDAGGYSLLRVLLPAAFEALRKPGCDPGSAPPRPECCSESWLLLFPEHGDKFPQMRLFTGEKEGGEGVDAASDDQGATPVCIRMTDGPPPFGLLQLARAPRPHTGACR